MVGAHQCENDRNGVRSGQIGPEADGRVYGDKSGIPAIPARPGGYQRIHRLYVRRLDLGLAQQDLHGAQVAGLLLNEGSLGPPQGMGSIILAAQAGPNHPFLNKARILAGAGGFCMIVSAGKNIISQRPAPPFQPSLQAFAGRLQQLELNWPSRFLFNNQRNGTGFLHHEQCR